MTLDRVLQEKGAVRGLVGSPNDYGSTGSWGQTPRAERWNWWFSPGVTVKEVRVVHTPVVFWKDREVFVMAQTGV